MSKMTDYQAGRDQISWNNTNTHAVSKERD